MSTNGPNSASNGRSVENASSSETSNRTFRIPIASARRPAMITACALRSIPSSKPDGPTKSAASSDTSPPRNRYRAPACLTPSLHSAERLPSRRGRTHSEEPAARLSASEWPRKYTRLSAPFISRRTPLNDWTNDQQDRPGSAQASLVWLRAGRHGPSARTPRCDSDAVPRQSHRR
jgi:hypothetical protein